MHEGHRQRMYEKLNNGGDLFDHEVLEILLYNVCPRVNTNPVAHALLERFVSLAEVFNASVEELKEVDGVGENVARFIKTVGLCAERAGKIGNAPTLKTFGDCKRFADLRLRGKSEEYVELYFVNKAYRVQRIFNYTSSEKSRAFVRTDEIIRGFALFRPFGVIVAHNHIEGTENPSGYDDEFTCIIRLICNMNGVKLLDHLIYHGKDKIYSYSGNGRLEKVNDLCGGEAVEKWIKTLN